MLAMDQAAERTASSQKHIDMLNATVAASTRAIRPAVALSFDTPGVHNHVADPLATAADDIAHSTADGESQDPTQHPKLHRRNT